MNDDQLIDLIYEAGLMPEKWPALLHRLSGHFGALGGMLLAKTADGLHGLHSEGFNQAWQEHLAEGWRTDTTRMDWLLADRHPGFRTDTDFVAREELANIPVYSEFLIPRGMDAGAGTLVPGAEGDLLLFSLEAFSDHDAARAALPALDRLRPHLARAAMLSAQLRLEQARGAVAALDLIGAGAAMIARTGVVRAANARFETMMFATTGAQDRIRLTDRETDHWLQRILAEVETGGRGGSIPVRTGEQIVALHVLPVRGLARDLFTGCSALVVATIPGVSAGADESLIRHLYDLTPAEARVAAAIGRGAKVDRIARDSGIAIGTVRNQLKSVFLKSGVTSQTELALLLADFARPATPSSSLLS